MPEAQLNVNPARAITWFVGVTICCAFFNNNSPSPRQFLCNKIPLKKISYSKGNAHWTNFWIDRAWTPWPCMYSYNWLFPWQNYNLEWKNIRLDCYLLDCRRQCTLLPPTWSKSQYLTPKCKILNVFWILIASKRRTEQLNFLNWLSNVKNLVLSNGSEYVRNVI